MNFQIYKSYYLLFSVFIQLIVSENNGDQVIQNKPQIIGKDFLQREYFHYFLAFIFLFTIFLLVFMILVLLFND